MPAISQAAHSKSISNKKSSGTYQPIMSNPAISTLISKWHMIWWVHPILWYSRLLPSNRSMFFLRLSRHSALPIFFVLAFEDLATLGRPCRQASWTDPWHLKTALKENATLEQRIKILDWYHKNDRNQCATAQHFGPLYPNVHIQQPLISSWV